MAPTACNSPHRPPPPRHPCTSTPAPETRSPTSPARQRIWSPPAIAHLWSWSWCAWVHPLLTCRGHQCCGEQLKPGSLEVSRPPGVCLLPADPACGEKRRTLRRTGNRDVVRLVAVSEYGHGNSPPMVLVMVRTGRRPWVVVVGSDYLSWPSMLR